VSDVFLFGTLQDRALRVLVFGSTAKPVKLEPTVLVGYKAVETDDFGGASLVPDVDGSVAGIVASGLSGDAVDRIRYYTQATGLDETNVKIGDATALAFTALNPADTMWSLDKWRAAHSQVAMRVAGDIMAFADRFSPTEMAQRLIPIRMRAEAWVTAQNQPARGEFETERDVIVHGHTRAYMNFFAVDEMDLQFRRFDGSFSEKVNRGALVMGDAVIVLPYDPVADTVLLIEQFRAPLFLGGSRNPWLFEPVAGLIDPGETPEQSAMREAREEAGISLTQLVPVGNAHSSSGSLSDNLKLFIGLADLSDVSGGGGLATEGEDIRSHVIQLDALMDGIDNQQFPHLPLQFLGLWLARHRERIRAMA